MIRFTMPKWLSSKPASAGVSVSKSYQTLSITHQTNRSTSNRQNKRPG